MVSADLRCSCCKMHKKKVESWEQRKNKKGKKCVNTR